jgi:hypothetical protein
MLGLAGLAVRPNNRCRQHLHKAHLLRRVSNLSLYAAPANNPLNRGKFDMNIAIALYGLSGLFAFIAARLRDS